MSSHACRRPVHPYRAVRSAIFLSALAVIGLLCAAIRFPFNVIAWSSVVAIAFLPVRRSFLAIRHE